MPFRASESSFLGVSSLRDGMFRMLANGHNKPSRSRPTHSRASNVANLVPVLYSVAIMHMKPLVLYSLCRYGGLVVSAVLVCTEHEGSNPGKDQPAPTTLRRHRAGMPPVASGQTGTASLAVQRPTDCTTVAPVAKSESSQRSRLCWSQR